MAWQDSLRILKQGTNEIIGEEDLVEKLKRADSGGPPLRVKLGLDPTAPDIHIGHTVPLRKMREFQDLGHEAYLIIGDFTGRIGDPSQKSETRKQLTTEEVMQNARTYQEQFRKILDPEKTHLVFNSDWFSKWTPEEFLTLSSKYTVARMLERDDFEKRYREGKPISILEFFYPLLQGYDSIAIEADVELGGTDQKFNLLVGRQLQKEYGQRPQALIMTPLLEGTDGVQKMSKSLNNYIGINEPPGEIYGKTMSISDDLLKSYITLTTDLRGKELDKYLADLENNKINPLEAKKFLARRLVEMYYDREAALKAEQEFTKVFSRGNLPEDMPEKEIEGDWLDENGQIRLVHILSQLEMVNSNSEGRRLVKQGGVYIDEERVEDPNQKIKPRSGMIIRVGKRKFSRLK